MIDVSDLIGIPFKQFGRNKHGYDCYGLSMEVLKRYGKTLKDVQLNHFLTIKGEEIEYIPLLNIKEVNELKEGLLLEFIGKNNALHVGVSIGKDLFIHATENQGVRISSLSSCKNYMTLQKMYEVI